MTSSRRRTSATLAAALTGALALGLIAVPLAAAAAQDSLIVTEIVADNVGVDEFEYVEVHNPTTQPLTLAAGQIELAYSYVDSANTTRDIPLQVEGAATVAPKETVVLWLSYTTETVDSFGYTVEDFRAHYGAAADVRVERLTGQAGMANGGERGIRVLSGAAATSWSFYPAGSVAADQAVHFRLPAEASDLGLAVLAGPAAPSPGVIAPEALVPAAAPDPEPDPDPEPAPDRQPDRDLVTAPLQITELLPNSTNVGTADGFEFVEIYNATSAPIDLADYTIVYLYPQDQQVNTNEAQWPPVPRSAVVAPGGTVVLWIKNGQNETLGAAEFNAEMGSDLTLGEDLLEIFSSGMANGSARGVAIRTNTGFDVNRAYYNMGGATDVSANQGIRYAVGSDDVRLQQIVDTAPASPGSVQADQIPAGLMVPPTDNTAPAVEDLTTDEIDATQDFILEFLLSDDDLVRTATLDLTNDVDAGVTTLNLLSDTGDDELYRHTVNRADLVGKSWFEYTLTVSDGTNATTTERVRVPIAGASTDPLRLNVEDGDHVAGTTSIAAAGETFPPAMDLSIDGQPVSTEQSLEAEPLFVFEVSQSDFYFRNGVRIGEDVLLIFDEGTYADTVTLATPVPLSHIEQGNDLVVSVWAGTKAAPKIDPDENNDDFVISGMRLVLPDGRTLRPAGYDDPTQLIQMGDSDGKFDFYDSAFTLPEDAFTALAHEWDTTTVPDGPHDIAATDGVNAAEATVQVDNTAPVVLPSVEEGRTYQGQIVLDADVTDAGVGVEEVSATLDEAPIELGDVTSSVELAEGEHVLEIVAVDELGNSTTSITTFAVPDELPIGTDFAPADGAVVAPGDVTLQARVTDPTEDDLDVQILQGYRFTEDDEEVTTTSGVVSDAATMDREGAAAATTMATPGARFAPPSADGPVTSADQLPYYTFDVEIPAGTSADDEVRLTWDGQADARAQVMLYALAADGDSWVEVDRHATDGEAFTLKGTVRVGDHLRDGVITVLVQHSEGFAALPQSNRESDVTPYHPDDVDRSNYDFTIGWESDTQYYNEEFTQHQIAIHDYLLERREDIDLRYVIHTGDIVDDYDQPYQWENADPQYARFDDAQLPYGVLAGNHDVGHEVADYSAYSEHFGEDRFAANPWYGGSFENNRGHYDLISAGGIDFLMLYMGWDPGQDAIDWMNDVLARYPERVAIISLHEYMLTTGGLGPIPQQIYDEVVATNPNVRMVLSGHYHDAFTRTDAFDDDGDGTDDRTVYSMLFDYQGLPEGGLGYLRLLHFDNEGQQMLVRTLSPSQNRYNSDDPNLLGPAEDPYAFQEFEISYADLRIAPRTRLLDTEGFTAEVLTTNQIASFDQVSSGSTVSAPWSLTKPGTYAWYVRTADAFGGVDVSAVRLIVVSADGSGGTGEQPSNAGDVSAGGDGANDPAGSGAGPGGLASTGVSNALALLMLALGVALLGFALKLRQRHPRGGSPRA